VSMGLLICWCGCVKEASSGLQCVWDDSVLVVFEKGETEGSKVYVRSEAVVN
jgi:hypothetical protein